MIITLTDVVFTVVAAVLTCMLIVTDIKLYRHKKFFRDKLDATCILKCVFSALLIVSLANEIRINSVHLSSVTMTIASLCYPVETIMQLIHDVKHRKIIRATNNNA